MKHEIKLQSHSIVAVGDLNPAIFQPAWFAGEGLITRGEAQAATVQMISAQAALFEVDWLSVQVLPERFVATTPNEAFSSTCTISWLPRSHIMTLLTTDLDAAPCLGF